MTKWPLEAGRKEDVYTLSNGVVVIRWPDRITAKESWDLEAWFDIMKRKIRLSVDDDNEENDAFPKDEG